MERGYIDDVATTETGNFGIQSGAGIVEQQGTGAVIGEGESGSGRDGATDLKCAFQRQRVGVASGKRGSEQAAPVHLDVAAVTRDRAADVEDASGHCTRMGIETEISNDVSRCTWPDIEDAVREDDAVGYRYQTGAPSARNLPKRGS